MGDPEGGAECSVTMLAALYTGAVAAAVAGTPALVSCELSVPPVVAVLSAAVTDEKAVVALLEPTSVVVAEMV